MMGRSLSLATLLVAVAILLGRLTGLFRVLGLASVLGVSHANDLAILVISVPDILNAMLIGGAMAAVLVPEMHRRSQNISEQNANQLIVQSFFVVAIVSSLFALTLAICSSWFTEILAFGFTSSQINEANKLIMIVLLAFPISAVTAVTAAALQGHHKPTIPAYGNLFFNVILLVAIFFWVSPENINVIAWAVVVAVSFRLLTQIIRCFMAGVFNGGFQSLTRFSTLKRSLLLKYFHALTAIGVVVAFPVVSRSFASAFEGGISLFEYALKLVEFPRGLLGAALTMVIFPRISHVFSEGNLAEATKLISHAAGLILLVTIPVTVAVYGCAEPVVSLLFQRGLFSALDVINTAKLLQIAIISMPALILSILTMNVFYARHETVLPFKISIISLSCLILLSLAVRDSMGVSGLMFAFVITSWFHFLALTISLQVKLNVSVIDGVKIKHCAALILLTLFGISFSAMMVKFVLEPVLLIAYSLILGLVCFGAVLLILKNHLPRFHRRLF
ncbi:murein biosynthesis integral membrane protein MurJ [Gimesia aquarii]|uniref:MurJ-like flippase n=1 Tax=Gimesia aquarii TaxID=2527964 RepID=A0A517WWU5_9PLAN|nr:lipid II flippase MurJ [Gimesia aquarii]QDU09743.1 MurJ-like flippase [Gimesia aquarii]